MTQVHAHRTILKNTVPAKFWSLSFFLYNIHFFFKCNSRINECDTLWAKLFEKIERVCALESSTFTLFASSLDQVAKLSFLVGGFEVPFGKRIVETSRSYTAVSVHKCFGIHSRMIADSTSKK